MSVSAPFQCPYTGAQLAHVACDVCGATDIAPCTGVNIIAVGGWKMQRHMMKPRNFLERLFRMPEQQCWRHPIGQPSYACFLTCGKHTPEEIHRWENIVCDR